jgi:LasA protease
MGVRRSTQSSARKRYYRRRFKRLMVLLSTALILAGVVGGGLVYPVLAPDSSLAISSIPSPTRILSAEPAVAVEPALPAEVLTVESPSPDPTPTSEPQPLPQVPLPTQGQIIPPSEDPDILYYTAAGDSLPVVSLRFGVNMDEIKSPMPIERKGLLPPGQLLIIPNRLGETSSRSKLLPDSEVTFSPSTVDFDIHGFVESAGGYLSTYSQWLATTGITSGAEVIARVSKEYSVNPRLLLAYLEFHSGWVYGMPESQFARDYPMGYVNLEQRGMLYQQAAWFASRVMDGYYGWKEGRRLVVTFAEGGVLRLAPELNAGSVGLMNAFTHLYGYEDWAHLMYGEQNFFDFYETMFDNPWIRAQVVEPLIPADIVQPEMILPFEPNTTWAFTGGPHAAWSAADVWAALDFAPPSSEAGCIESFAWVVASVPGLVVRSEHGVVVIDMDGDGYEQTGWSLLYLHIATKNRVPVGTWVEVGDRIGHPSCEGGRSTGTHVHIARRYNGEWVPADGPLPFVLSGWTARASSEVYKGWLIRGTDIIYANTSASALTHIRREE